jgi:hypothetical protein
MPRPYRRSTVFSPAGPPRNAFLYRKIANNVKNSGKSLEIFDCGDYITAKKNADHADLSAGRRFFEADSLCSQSQINDFKIPQRKDGAL